MNDPMLPLPGLSPVSGKTIVAKFDGGLLSSDGGIVVLRGGATGPYRAAVGLHFYLGTSIWQKSLALRRGVTTLGLRL